MNMLAEINLLRLGKNYADMEAAIEVDGGWQKKPLTAEKSPFVVVVFLYGENRKAYWNYAHMVVLQFEDAVDVLQVLYPTFDFVFLFDHNAGHCKQQIDGLNQLHKNDFLVEGTLQWEKWSLKESKDFFAHSHVHWMLEHAANEFRKWPCCSILDVAKQHKGKQHDIMTFN